MLIENGLGVVRARIYRLGMTAVCSSLKAAPIKVRYEIADPVALSFATKASAVTVEARVELEPVKPVDLVRPVT